LVKRAGSPEKTNGHAPTEDEIAQAAQAVEADASHATHPAAPPIISVLRALEETLLGHIDDRADSSLHWMRESTELLGKNDVEIGNAIQALADGLGSRLTKTEEQGVERHNRVMERLNAIGDRVMELEAFTADDASSSKKLIVTLGESLRTLSSQVDSRSAAIGETVDDIRHEVTNVLQLVLLPQRQRKVQK
jgi:hypothetical protein